MELDQLELELPGIEPTELDLETDGGGGKTHPHIKTRMTLLQWIEAAGIYKATDTEYFDGVWTLHYHEYVKGWSDERVAREFQKWLLVKRGVTDAVTAKNVQTLREGCLGKTTHGRTGFKEAKAAAKAAALRAAKQAELEEHEAKVATLRAELGA